MSSRNPRFGPALFSPLFIGVLGLTGCQELQKGVSDMQTIAASKAATARNKDNVELTVTATPSVAAPGQKVMYEVTVKNGGNAPVRGFNVFATIPEHTTVALTEATSQASCSGRKNVCRPAEQIAWSHTAYLAPGNAWSLHFYARVDDNPPAPAGTRLRSVVTASQVGLKVTAEPVVRQK